MALLTLSVWALLFLSVIYLSMMLCVSELFIYPVKSLAGIALSSARVTDRGFEHDRRWMLVDKDGVFISQREMPQMALLGTEIKEDSIRIFHKQKVCSFNIPFLPSDESLMVQIWSNRCKGQLVGKDADEWFSDVLSKNCRLVHMIDDTRRRVDSRYAQNKEITSFSDGYPLLLIGQSSLDDLNSRLIEKLPINRFRPNIVFTGGQPFEEDGLAHFSINNMDFFGVKLCSRCVITTIDQETGIRAKEPLKTLASYRLKNNKVYFGQNLLHAGEGVISIGDDMHVRQVVKPRITHSHS